MTGLNTAGSHPDQTAFELRFEHLFTPGRALSFPCDQSGQVDLKAMSARAQASYQWACSSVGREYAAPAVQLHD